MSKFFIISTACYLSLACFAQAEQTEFLLPQEEQQLEEDEDAPQKEGEIADRERGKRSQISLYEKNRRRLEQQEQRAREKAKCTRPGCSPY